MAPKPASTAGRSLGGRSSALSNYQQTAAPPSNLQQQHGAGTGTTSATGGSQAPGGVPALLLAKGYDVLGIIGEVWRPDVLWNCDGCEPGLCPPQPRPWLLIPAGSCLSLGPLLSMQGTFGRVYLARHSSQPGRFLALKHMKPPQVLHVPIWQAALSCLHALRSLACTAAPCIARS